MESNERESRSDVSSVESNERERELFGANSLVQVEEDQVQVYKWLRRLILLLYVYIHYNTLLQSSSQFK